MPTRPRIPPSPKWLTLRRNSAKPFLYGYTSLDGALNNTVPLPSIATALPLAFTKARSSLNLVSTSDNALN